MAEPTAKQPVTAESLRDLYLKFGRPHYCLSHTDQRHGGTLWRLVQIAQDKMTLQYRNLVTAAGNRPLLYSYSSDATPALTQKAFISKAAGVRPTRREFSEGVEYLLQTAWVKTTDPVGYPVQMVLMKQCVPLTEKKTALEEFTAYNRFAHHPRMLGHGGILLMHYCFDRQMYSALSRLARQKSELYYDILSGGRPRTPDNKLKQIKEIVLSTACCAHDVQNALKWSMQPIADKGSDVHKALYVSLSALRQAFNLLVQKLPAFVSGRLTPVVDLVYDDESWYQFFMCMGVEDTLARRLCEMGLHYADKQLKLRHTFGTMPDLVPHVVALLTSLFTFKQFTDSRWLTIGCSCRTFVASHALGLADLVALVRADPAMSDYYMGGYGFTNQHVLQYATTAAMASHVGDTALRTLVEDDRLARNVGGLVQKLREEMFYVQNLPMEVYRIAAATDGSSAGLLRSNVVKAGWVQASFFHMRALKDAQKYPWRLCQGDNILANLEEFAKARLGREFGGSWQTLSFSDFDLWFACSFRFVVGPRVSGRATTAAKLRVSPP